MIRLLFATGNKGKLREAAEILGPEYVLSTPAEFGVTEEIPETGETLKENSIQKAQYLFERTGMSCFADDTGLEVDCLGGAPGVYTARYAGEHCSFDDNMAKLLREMAALGPDVPRTARFRSVVTLMLPCGDYYCFEGCVEGKIATQRSGCQGFGYDPVFIPDGFGGKTFAEISEEEKNAVSHRGKALRAMAAFLAQ